MKKNKIVQALILLVTALLLLAAALLMFMRVSDNLLDMEAQKEKQIQKDLGRIKKLASSGEVDKAEKSMGEFFKKYGPVSDESLKKAGGLDESRETAQLTAVMKEENRVRTFEKTMAEAEKLSGSNSAELALKEAEKALSLARDEDETLAAEDLIEKLKSPSHGRHPNDKLTDEEKAKYSTLMENGKKLLDEEKFDEAVKAFDAAVSIQPTPEALENLARAAGMLEVKLRKNSGKK